MGPDEGLLLRRLAAFAGSFSLSAAEEVCSDDRLSRRRVLELLPALVDKSLLHTDPFADAYRYRLLESIRWFAWERLEDRDSVIGRLLSYLVGFAEDAEAELRGPQQREWLERLSRDLPNIRRVLEWAIQVGEAERAFRLVAALELFWDYRDLRREGVGWVERTLDSFPEAPSLPRLRVMFVGAALLEPWDTHQAIGLAEEAMKLAEGEVSEMRARLALGGALIYEPSRAAESRRHLEEASAYFESIADSWRHGLALMQLGILSDPPEAIDFLNAAGRCFARTGDRIKYGNVRYVSAAKLLRHAAADLARVSSWTQEALQTAEEFGSRHEQAHARSLQAIVDFRRGHLDRAMDLCEKCLVTFRQGGDTRCTARMLSLKGMLMIRRGETIEGEACFSEAVAEALRANDLATAAESLDGLGALTEGAEAVRFHAAAQAQRAAARASLNASGVSFEDRLKKLRQELGDQAFTIAWEEGQTLDPRAL